MKDLINEQQSKVNAEAAMLKQRIFTAKKLGDDIVAKELTGQLKESAFRGSELATARVEIGKMEKSKQKFIVRAFSSDDDSPFGHKFEGKTKYSEDDGAVVMGFLFGDYTSLLHELKHGYDFLTGELSFNPTKMDVNKAADYAKPTPGGSLYDINDEVRAWRRDYSLYGITSKFLGTWERINSDNLSQMPGYNNVPCDIRNIRNYKVPKTEITYKTHKN